jgi:SAM-dependent MidA family methyltransferase
VTSEFESAIENTALKNVIVAEIEGRGGIPFRDFMDLALYHPQHGYYTSEREKMGRDGDYLTSPEVSPLFGAMIGRQLREMWQAMDRPDPFTIAECGAGNGTLARDILAWANRAAPDLYSAISYQIIEISEPLRHRQRARLEADGLADRGAWSADLPGDITGCILSNELLDAMPIHRVTTKADRLREVFVGWDGTGFTEDLHDPSPGIAEYFDRLNLQPGDGCLAEVNLAAVEWDQAAGKALGRGFVLTFDYGYGAQDLYAPWRKDGTLLGFYRHNPTTNPYARIGRQDLTSHVDFTSVKRAGEAAGLTTAGFVTQSEFLGNLGIHEALQSPTGAGLEEHFARRRAVTELMDPAGLGRIKVLLQSKEVSGDALSGFSL